MKNQKTILVGIAVLIVVALLVYHFSTDTVATTDYGITNADIECSGDNYVFTGTFYTWCVGPHQVQIFCDDPADGYILDFYEVTTPSSGTYDWSETYNIDDFDALMSCDAVRFQLYDINSATAFWKTKHESIPDCGTTPTPSECDHYFIAVDGDGDPMPEKTRFDFFEKDNGVWVSGGSYTILADSPLGMSLWLRSDTQYKAVPVWYEAAGWATPDDWILPHEQVFYGCSRDCTFVYESSTPYDQDILVLGGVAGFVLLILFAYRKKPPITSRRKK